MSLSRPTANKYARKFSAAAVICSGVLGLSAVPAMAGGQKLQLQPSQLLAATCASQTFGQPFQALGDSNSYTLVPGSEFNSPSEGWQLQNGASIVQTTRPDGTTGGALSLPAGSVAVSPPVCVNLLYPTARVWENSSGSAIAVQVAYAETKTAAKPKTVGKLEGEGSGWNLSEAFEVRPEIAGKEEGNRTVRFVFSASKDGSESMLYGLYVDPRMR